MGYSILMDKLLLITKRDVNLAKNEFEKERHECMKPKNYKVNVKTKHL